MYKQLVGKIIFIITLHLFSSSAIAIPLTMNSHNYTDGNPNQSKKIINKSTFLAISDIHLNNSNASSITYGQDSGIELWNNVKNKMTDIIHKQTPKFIILLGDLPNHNDLINLQTNIAAVLKGLSGLDAISKKNIPVFYAFGNNDSLENNYGPYAFNGQNLFILDTEHNSPATKGWPTLNANPDCTISPSFACTYTTTSPMPATHASDMAHVMNDGYYSAYPLGGKVPLRLISLNTVIFSRSSLITGSAQLYAVQTEMDWFEDQLASAKANNEFVYIIMHIPVGMDAFYNLDDHDMWNSTLILNNGLRFRDAFLVIMEKYKDNIRIVLSGHTHEDELRALYSNKALKKMSALDLGVPGVTPSHFNNPAIQIYLFDPLFRLEEIKTYYTTPTPTDWKIYSFLIDYNCPKNSTIFSCVSFKILPQLSIWKLKPQPIAGNPYELNYPTRAPDYNPSPSNWLTILDTIQVIPIV